MNTFDEIFVIDLHGNVMKKEVTPTGEKDENVFDIQQGVSINIFIKKGKKKEKEAVIHYSSIFGKRESKYDILSKAFLDNLTWTTVSPTEPFYFFIPRNEDNRQVYESGFSIKELMPEHTTGVVTARDGLVINTSKERLIKQIESFVSPDKTDDYLRHHFFGNKKSGKYLPGDSRGWSLSSARKKILSNDHEKKIKKIEYRPFDIRYIYYDSQMVDWGREKLMIHLLKGDNYGLIIPRQAATDNWSHVQITRYMADNRVHYSNKGIPIECPLYLYEDHFGELVRRPNLNSQIIQKISDLISLTFDPNGEDISGDSFTPLNVIDYIYAVLFSNKYREAYLEFLKYDFPRIPYPHSREYFMEMGRLGARLRLLHTDETNEYDHSYSFTGADHPVVQKPKFKNNKIILNETGDSFTNIPEDVWTMYFGGYQPLQKWLKDRKNQELSADDIEHYMHIATVLLETKNIMKKIDDIIQLD